MNRVYDEAGNMLETHEQAGEGEDRFGEWNLLLNLQRLSGKET
jgi:hypothetical protein